MVHTSGSLGGIRGARQHLGPRGEFTPSAVLETTTKSPAMHVSDGDVIIPFPKTTLRCWNVLMCLFHTSLAVVTLALGNPDLKVPIFRTSLSFDVLLNGTWVTVRGNATNGAPDTTAFRLWPYYEESGELALVNLTAAFFILSAVFHFLNATLLWSFYARMLERCYTPTRWVEYTFSAPIMFILIAYGLGMRGRGEFIASIALIATTMFFGFWVEREGRPLSESEWSRPFSVRIFPFVLGHVPQIAAWLLVILQFYDNGWELDRVPWFVHVILWAELILFFSFGLASFLSQWSRPALFYRGEIAFQILSLVSKGLLGILLISNILMLQRFEEVYEDEVAL